MSSDSSAVQDWVESRPDSAGFTLSSRYLGEEVSLLNADQAVELVNGLWHDFCRGNSDTAADLSDAEAAARFGEWKYVRGGTGQLVLAIDENDCRVARNMGGWLVADEKTVALLEGLHEAAPVERRP